MVVNGKFAAAAPATVKALNKVDFPTLGSPTIPISMSRILPAQGLKVKSYFYSTSQKMSANNPDDYGEIIEENFAMS